MSALPDGDGWLGPDGRATGLPRSDSLVRLWHPIDAAAEEIAAWRATLALMAVTQPIRQADREVFRPQDRDVAGVADRRFSGRVVDHARLRALLRDRGWAVPVLGAWDQGDEAIASRPFDGGTRAELAYQAVERPPTGSRHERARLVAVRFVRLDDGGTSTTLPDPRGRARAHLLGDASGREPRGQRR